MESGILIPILEKRNFEHSYLAVSQTYETIIHPAIDVARFSIVHLMFRVHALNIGAGGAGAKYEVLLVEVDPSAEDGADFKLGSTFLTSTAVTSSTVAPQLTKDSPGAGAYPGPFLRVIVKATQTSGTAVNLAATLSADLLCRAGRTN